jgi:hypothetical protein
MVMTANKYPVSTHPFLFYLNVYNNLKKKVRNLSISAFRNSFITEIELKIKEVLERLKTLAQQIDLLGLRVGVAGKLSERLPITSLIEESDICGRNDENEAIIKMLLSDDAHGNEMSVIAIVGMGGLARPPLLSLYTITTR